MVYGAPTKTSKSTHCNPENTLRQCKTEESKEYLESSKDPSSNHDDEIPLNNMKKPTVVFTSIHSRPDTVSSKYQIHNKLPPFW